MTITFGKNCQKLIFKHTHMWEKIKKQALIIYKSARVRGQIYSFVKTYATVFLALYVRDTVGEATEGQDLILFNMAVIGPAAKWSLIAVLRNIYKLITE